MKCIELATGKTLSAFSSINCIAAIGNFDGVHLGHQKLLQLAANRPCGTERSAIFTFSSPASLVLGRTDSLLTTNEERFSLFRENGIDLAFTEDFDAIRNADTVTFTKLLFESGIHVAVCGSDFRYGKNAMGTAEMLKKEFSALGGDVIILPPVTERGEPISATKIRAFLKNGKPEEAAALLGREYSLSAPVTEGKKLGRTWGFPTANLSFPPYRIVPKFGVYAVRVIIDGKTHYGVSNVGIRPTVEHDGTANCETHILNFSGNLYGKTITVKFCRFLREETKFTSKEALCNAIRENIAETRSFFGIN